jgi:hypothetical protein
MVDCIAWFLGPLLRWLFPAPGRRRAADPPSVSTGGDVPTLILPHYALEPPSDVLDGNASPLVRPYVLAAEGLS